MENMIVACIQQRMSVQPTHEEFEAEARRFLRQAQAKAVQLTIFPELTGVMLAPPLISGLKLGLVKRENQGKQPGAGFFSRRMGSVAGSTAGAMGGGFRGSLGRLLRKKSDALQDIYFEMFGRLAREFGTAIVGGSLYLYDGETDSIKHRAYVFDVSGDVVGYQDKFNLAPDEQDLATPGNELNVIETRYGRVGLLLGRDILYPELARLLVMEGADLLIGLAASPGAAQASVLRSALALRAEENQVYTAGSFLLGPNHLGKENREDFYGQSALLAPISLTTGGKGILVQAGTDRTEGLIATELDMEALYTLRETSGFRPRQEMHLGNAGPALADFYRSGGTIEENVASVVQPLPEPVAFAPMFADDPLAEPMESETELPPGPEGAFFKSEVEPESEA